MHPTIDEQLRGALRLLAVLDETAPVSEEAGEILANVRRLVLQSQRASVAAMAFYQQDNHDLANLLARLDSDLFVGGTAASTADPAVHNTDLRAHLSRVIHQLPAHPEGDEHRAEIRHYLLRRVEQDPV